MENDGERFALSDATHLANAIPVGIAVADLSGKLLFVNTELERMTGHGPGALLGRSVDVLLPERNRAGHVAERAAYVREPTTRHMGVGRELFALRADGSEFPVEVGLRPMDVAGGKAILASVIDVSQRRQLESGFRAVVEAAPYGMLLTDTRGIITMTNGRLNTMFGYAGAELLGQPIEMLLPRRQRQAHVAERDAYARSPTPRVMGSGRDLTGRRKDGIEIPVEIALSSVTTAAGRMSLAAVVDITQRKRAELKLSEANAQLEEFVYVASHDLRSPIRAIASLVDFIREDYGEISPPPLLRNLERMNQRVKRMEGLIEDLLVYAGASKRSVKIEPIDLPALIEDVLELDPLPSGMKLELDIDVPIFNGAKTPLTTVLRNLYNNAIKHHDRPGGCIKVYARETGEHCIIDVVDDGPGIPEAAQERVFRLFQTLMASDGKGSGLGLALVQRLVEGHGGRIELLSADGERGCTFRVWWPCFMRSDLVD